MQDAAEKVRGCKPKATHPEADLSTRCRGAAPSGTASLQPQATTAALSAPASLGSSVEFITDELVTSDRPAKGHFYVTLISTKTGQERAIDLLLSQNSFARLTQVLRQHISYEWELYEWIDIDLPF